MKTIKVTVVAPITLDVEITEEEIKLINEDDGEIIYRIRERAKDMFDDALISSSVDLVIHDSELENLIE